MSVRVNLSGNEAVEHDVKIKKQKTLPLPNIEAVRVLPLSTSFGSPLKKRVTDQRSNKPLHTSFASTKRRVRRSLRHISPYLTRQAKQIEAWMDKKEIDVKLITLIRSTIQGIYDNSSWDLSRKRAELGSLFFYLTRDGEIPLASSLVDYRCMELETHLSELRERHVQHCPEELMCLLPSGQVAYLMRAFVRMVFTPDGSFNEGGCFALKELLQTPLAVRLSQEKVSQISRILELLIDDTSFREKFMQPFTVHEAMREFIQIDMQLPADEEITFLYVRWDLLIALFSVIGQVDEGNCYAIAVTSNLFAQNPEILLDMMIDGLKRGYFLFEGAKIPIPPLLESRRRYEVDFESSLSSQSAVHLIGFSLARESLGVRYEVSEDVDHETSLDHLMRLHFQKQVSQAKSIFLSLKYNLLQQMLLCIFQFTSSNSSKIVLEKERIVSQKSLLFRALDKLVLKDYLCTLGNAWKENLFLIDFRSWSQKLDSGRVVSEFHSQGLQADGKLSDFEPLMHVRRLCLLRDGQLYPIDRISHLTAYLRSCVDGNNSDTIALKHYLKSEEAAQEIAKIVQALNRREVNFPWKSYFESDSFLLVQDGGSSELITESELLKGHFSFPTTLSGKNVDDLFLNICEALRAFQIRKPSFFDRIDPQVLMTSPVHTFNLNPLNFRRYFETENPYEELEKSLVAPAMALMNHRPSELEKKYLLSHLISEEAIKEIYSKVPKLRVLLKWTQFREEIFKVLDPSLHPLFDQVLNGMLTKISMRSFEKECPEILERLDIHLTPLQQESILAYVQNNSENASSILTGELTDMLFEVLKKNSISHASPNRIERELCDFYQLPQIIDLGSLNWIDQLQEHVSCIRLILKYNAPAKTFVLCKRNDGIDTDFNDDFVDWLLKSTKLYFENSSTSLNSVDSASLPL